MYLNTHHPRSFAVPSAPSYGMCRILVAQCVETSKFTFAFCFNIRSAGQRQMKNAWTILPSGTFTDGGHNSIYILDVMTWPEEEQFLPHSVSPNDPSFFLFATSNNYYVHQYKDNKLFNAGTTLEDVYWGASQAQTLQTAIVL